MRHQQWCLTFFLVAAGSALATSEDYAAHQLPTLQYNPFTDRESKSEARDMKAEVIQGAIVLTAVYPDWDGKGGVLETTCSDYDHYVRLPAVVSYNGVRYGKTGWSSDRNYACYKSNTLTADSVR